MQSSPSRTRSVTILAAMALAILACPLAAQPWPSKPIKIVVPWPPGGSADLLGRMVADHLTNTLGQTVVVENRPGATGMIGSAIVARADPDGATFVISGIPSHAIAPAVATKA